MPSTDAIPNQGKTISMNGSNNGKEPGISFVSMLELIKQLRSENGCPWDRKQTLESFHPYVLEEYHELVHAITENDTEAMVDEAGDLMFLVTFICYMLEQTAVTSVTTILEGSISKMTLRHPHVFGDVEVKNAQDVIDNWSKIKASEKLIQNRNSVLDGIPRSAPALTRAQKMTSRAAKVGFDWPGVADVFEKVYEELSELKLSIETADKDSIKSEVGDVLFSVVNLARHLSVNCESALTSASHRFENRFHYIEDKLRQSGTSVNEASLEEMDRIWDEAKSTLG